MTALDIEDARLVATATGPTVGAIIIRNPVRTAVRTAIAYPG